MNEERCQEARLLFEGNPELERIEWHDGFTLSRKFATTLIHPDGEKLVRDCDKDGEATGDEIADAIIDGLYDADIELILEAAHHRKRELRGARVLRVRKRRR